LDQRGPVFSSGRVLSVTNSLSSTVHTGTAGFTQMISPEISNEVRANYSNHRVDIKFVMDDFGGAEPLPDSFLFPSGITSDNGTFLFIILGVGRATPGQSDRQPVSDKGQPPNEIRCRLSLARSV
jgi:hypothetical protein